MSYPIRKHFLANFQALNRRKIVDNFNQAADNLNNVSDYSIKRKTLDRTVFRDNSFHEFLSNFDYQNPNYFDFYGAFGYRTIPNSLVQVETKEYGEYLINYSLELGSGGQDPSPIMVHLFVNGKVLGQGADMVDMPWPWYDDTGTERRDYLNYSTATAAANYPDLVLDTTSGTNTSISSGTSIEDPGTSQYGAIRTPSGARSENFSGQAVVALNQGKFSIGLVWDYSRYSEGAKEEEGQNITFHKCSVTVDRRLR